MAWNVNPGKCEALESEEIKNQTSVLSGKYLWKTSKVTYLRVSVSTKGLTDSKILDRAHKAKIAVHQVRPLGVSSKGVSI